ncbi:DUF5047 domain-containing protein [Allostreptomyces psammosilenae]|uniref:DUF5047 domain-containing protein n=1 Tax=Allostreptomyces psammosilenae TaxID=1892865 RepID=A0A852ZUK3_9ACTN|nr:DUF5047 domain-containing protein [Allostreptomyces psammosilenae]NYI06073.1 hypothetical protein [Allostreptomyces psammosilenae]
MKVNVLYGGSVVAEDIAFTDGTVTVDRGSEIRRTLSLTIPDPHDFPVSATDRYGVYGQAIYVEAGMTYIDGTSERVAMGTFTVTRIGGNVHEGPLSITAVGPEIHLKRSVFTTAYNTNLASSAAAFITTQIAGTIPGATLTDMSTHGGTTLPSKTWDAGTEKWAALTEVAASIGAELYAAPDGNFVLADVPDIAGAVPVWDVTTGDSGVMVSADLELTSDQVFNRVVVVGENAAEAVAPVSAEARITDPADPLRYGGPFGEVTRYYSSNLITTSTAAQVAADAMLTRYRAPNRTVSLSTVPNAALEPGDCIRVAYADLPPELHLVQSVTIPLSVSSGASSIATISGREE